MFRERAINFTGLRDLILERGKRRKGVGEEGLEWNEREGVDNSESVERLERVKEGERERRVRGRGQER